VRGLCVEAGRARVRDDLEPPADRGRAEVPVRMRLAGVCATDLALARGYMGFAGTPGHEFVGTALAGPLAGRRVVGEINAGCGACAPCRGGDPRHCPARTVLGIVGRPGAFAEELALPAANLIAVPDELPDEVAVFCEPLAAALAIAERVDLAGIEAALVIGDGRLGLLCAHGLLEPGAPVTLAGRHPARAALLPARDGRTARHVVGLCEPLRTPGAPPPDAADRFDLVIEATGRPEVLTRALERARPRGTVVQKTTSERPCALDLSPLVIDELTLVGSRCGRLGPALAWLAERRGPGERRGQAREPRARAGEALAPPARGGAV
jgi:threonine dehydrogenase-like Zn-dependent dehydrogenase